MMMIGVLTRAWQRWLNRHDPAWQPTGYRYTTDRQHDEGKASAAVKRARQTDATRRKLAAKRAQQVAKQTRAPVIVLPTRKAGR